MNMEQGARSGAPLNTPTGQPNSIKAIETRYKGYHFRSRLEARWAVFFDAMELDWDYEPQGFDLPSGNYLPDFRVYFSARNYGAPGTAYTNGLWIEVKGSLPSDREKALATDLFWGTRTPVAIVSQLTLCRVECHPWDCFCAQALRTPGTGADERTQTWLALPAWLPTGARAFLSAGGDCGTASWNTAACSRPRLGEHLSLWPGDCWSGQMRSIEECVNAARSARFEHGHSGAS